MRYALLAFVLCAGCDDTPTERQWYDYSLVLGRDTDRLDALERKVGALPDPTLAVMPLAERIAAMEKRIAAIEEAVAKQSERPPHLYAVDGTDLGRFAGWDQAWSDALTDTHTGETGAYYAITYNRTIIFGDTDCTPPPRLSVGAADVAAWDYFVASTGTIVRVTGPVEITLYSSAMDSDKCVAFKSPGTTPAAPFEDMKIPARNYQRSALRTR